MNKVMLGLVTASLATVAGGISLTHYFSDYASIATAETASAQEKVEEEALEPAVETVESEDKSQTEAVSQIETAIATTYNHQLDGRNATTVYIQNIPVATFLGDKVTSDDVEKVATSTDGLPIEGSKNIIASEEFINRLNQFTLDGTAAENIGVKWDKDKEGYVIHLDQDPLIAMSDDVIFPSTTKDKAEDALQITNRLRRQIGNVKPLKTIEGQPPKPVKVAVAPTNVQRYQQGWASWYGPGFHGNLTADGTRYNQYGLTAAHRTLPFGTRLRVTNQNNGRSVVVVVNDRGPFIHNRVIDLSLGAAEVIGVINSGVAPVTIDIVN